MSSTSVSSGRVRPGIVPALLLATGCALATPAQAQTAAAIPPAAYGQREAGEFGDRQAGSFGDIDPGHFGDAAEGSFRTRDYSRLQEGQTSPLEARPVGRGSARAATTPARPQPAAESPYITLPQPLDPSAAPRKR